jgi:GDP-4-dehydro-6-deoxy-D-mannose reductase
LTDLVVGAGGFVGPYLTSHLRAAGRDVVALDAVPGDDVDEICDICSPTELDETIARIAPRRVFHLAAQSSPRLAREQPAETYRINVHGTLNLLVALRRRAPGCRMLFTSTSTVYGHVPPEAVPLREERRPYPPGPYEGSKQLAETLCGILGADGRIEVVVVRPFNHTGPGQSPHFVVPALVRRVAAVALGTAEPLIETGNLHPRRDFTDVRDVVRAYRGILDRALPGSVINVCSGQARSIGSLVGDLLRLAGVEAEVRVDPARQRPYDVEVVCGDTRRLEEVLGWIPDPLGDPTLSEMLAEALEEVRAEGRGVRA